LNSDRWDIEYTPIIGQEYMKECSPKQNKLYIFRDENKIIRSIFIDFNIACKYIYEDLLVTSEVIDGKDAFRINVGCDIYVIVPDVVEYIDVTTINKQAIDYIKKK